MSTSGLEQGAIQWLERAVTLGPAVFTTSLGVEDMVIGELIAKNNLPIRIATLDTGRLFPETLELIETAQARFKRPIEVFFPQSSSVEQFVQVYGVNGFKQAKSTREYCCEVRKLEPLGRALAGAKVWVTGLRKAQSDNRANVQGEEFDTKRSLTKIAPLIDWTDDAVWAYAKANGIPYNPLHDRGFSSIGCAPCTRAIAPGEHPRAGRWWWEQDTAQECGLHAKATS